MRFLADMGISPLTIQFLRQLGHDSTHLRDEGLQRLADDDILPKAAAEGRVLLTCDLDFGYLMARSQSSAPTVVLFRLSSFHPDAVNARLGAVLRDHAANLAEGAFVLVTDSRIRVRRLQIE